MSGLEYLIALGWVALFTLLFDMFDLKPEASSYLFARTLSYVIYLSFRTALGMVAVFGLAQAEVSLPLFVAGMIGTLANRSIIESLSLPVPGERLAVLEPLLARFRLDILADNTRRMKASEARRRYKAVRRLAELKEPMLRLEFDTIVGQLKFAGEELKANLQAQLNAISSDEGPRRQTALAAALVEASEVIGPGVLDSVMAEMVPTKGRAWWPLRRG